MVTPSIKLDVPRRVLDRVSFTDGTLEDLEAWMKRLPREPEAAARELRNGLMQLNRAKSFFTARFPELELLRPKVHAVCRSLGESAEGKRLAQMLQMELSTGYQVAVVETIEEQVPLEGGGAVDSPSGMAIVSIHRALSEMGETLLRALQFDAPSPSDLWTETHQLYLLAESAGVLEVEVRDDLDRVRDRTRVVDAWLRVVLLGSTDPNALRRAQLSELHELLSDWTRLVEVCREAPEGHAAVVVDLHGAGPPERGTGGDLEGPSAARWLEASALVEALRERIAGRGLGAQAPALPNASARILAEYAQRIWGAQAERGSDRLDAPGEAELCVGWASVHRRLRGTLDDEPVHLLTISDASPGGYGLTTGEALPDRLQTGELVAVRRRGTHPWQVAVVRWRAGTPALARIGIELLSPRAEAAAARHEGDAEHTTVRWSPVLLLPEIAALRRPATLIVPRGRFVNGSRLTLRRHRGTSTITLGRARSFAESFEEFSIS
ncbi:MAG: hypothetical protein V2J24_17515 [Pseudomonadales bacterium]|jgi:hypothetical protein|nr:hypothetical protein [Pseudomonadales bacterium]